MSRNPQIDTNLNLGGLRERQWLVTRFFGALLEFALRLSLLVLKNAKMTPILTQHHSLLRNLFPLF